MLKWLAQIPVRVWVGGSKGFMMNFQELSRSLETIEGARHHMILILFKCLSHSKTTRSLSFTVMILRKIFFDNLKLYITRKELFTIVGQLVFHIAWLFDIDSFQYTMTPSNQLLEIEVFKRYLIGRQIIDFEIKCSRL